LLATNLLGLPSVTYTTDNDKWGPEVITIAAWIVVGLAGVAILVALGWFPHRLCIRLEGAGYPSIARAEPGADQPLCSANYID
jgi:hypothetical protein